MLSRFASKAFSFLLIAALLGALGYAFYFVGSKTTISGAADIHIAFNQPKEAALAPMLASAMPMPHGLPLEASVPLPSKKPVIFQTAKR